jgi:Family of unknown function (DUF6445)
MKIRRFLFVRDDFYSDPDSVRRIAQSMRYRGYGSVTGHMTEDIYHERGARKRLEKILGVRVTDWLDYSGGGNGIFYWSFSRGRYHEIPAVHYDTPRTSITVLVYLTPGLSAEYGTSFWEHKRTKIVNAPEQSDARRLKTTLTALNRHLGRDAESREKWSEIDRVGYKYNRMIAFTSGMLHSASRHYGHNLQNGRVYQAFRIGVDWSKSNVYR